MYDIIPEIIQGMLMFISQFKILKHIFAWILTLVLLLIGTSVAFWIFAQGYVLIFGI